MPLVLEHPLLGDLKPALGSVLAQRRGLRADRLVLLLPGAGHPGVDRRAGHEAAFLPGRPGSGPAAAVRESRRPPVKSAAAWRPKTSCVSTARLLTCADDFCDPGPGTPPAPAPRPRRWCAPTPPPARGPRPPAAPAA